MLAVTNANNRIAENLNVTSLLFSFFQLYVFVRVILDYLGLAV
jgi:hypothetical protein